jgi:hypothetical protein
MAQAQTSAPSTIRFEDATKKAGIQFTHSFGARELGSLLESTGAGCVWFDFNNDGLPDLYVVSGKPLGGNIHPYPLKQPPAIPPHNHLYKNNGDGTFTDVTDSAGVAGNIFGMAAIAADFDNDGFVDLFVTGFGQAILYHNKGDGTFEDVTAKAGIKVDGWSIGAAWLDYDRDGWQSSVSQQLQRNLHRCDGEVWHRRIQGPDHGRDRGGLRWGWLSRHLCGE